MRKVFTIIELLVVVAIIGVLASIALSVSSAAKKKSADASVKSGAQTFLKAWITMSSDQAGYYTPTTSNNRLCIADPDCVAPFAANRTPILDIESRTQIANDLGGLDITPPNTGPIYFVGYNGGTASLIGPPFAAHYDSTSIAVMAGPLNQKAPLNPESGIYEDNSTNIGGLYSVSYSAVASRSFFVVVHR